LLPSQRQRLLFPGTSDECHHFHCSIICPQNAQHLSPVIHVEPVRQVRLRVLPFDGVSIAWRGCLTGSQVTERCPVTKGPGANPQLNDPHGVTLNFQRRATSIFTNPSGVPIFNFSSRLPTEAALSIPKIRPPAFCTTWPYLLSASARLVMSMNLPIRFESRKGLPFFPRLHSLTVIAGARVPRCKPTPDNFLVQISRRAR